MFEIDVTCTGPDCEEEFQVWVEDLDEVEAAVCDSCGHAVVTLRVAAYEPELPVLLSRVRERRARSRDREPDPIAA
jgi:Zn ribbon nucleic-acid-binding protein